MEKKFNGRHATQIKNTAKSVDSYRTKIAKLTEKKDEIDKEIESCNKEIELWEAPIVHMTGYTTAELVDKVRVKSGVDTKTGKDIYKSDFKLKYPDTIIPPVTIGEHGSDFDEDTEKINEETEENNETAF